jgi:hypothetical protein
MHYQIPIAMAFLLAGPLNFNVSASDGVSGLDDTSATADINPFCSHADPATFWERDLFFSGRVINGTTNLCINREGYLQLREKTVFGAAKPRAHKPRR